MNSSFQVAARHSISVVTPVYNSEASIAELCQRLSEVLPRIATEYEIILVNDGSRDRSWETISELSSRFATVRGLNLMRNYGQHNALLCGIRPKKSRDCSNNLKRDSTLFMAPPRKNGTNSCALLLPALRGSRWGAPSEWISPRT